MAGDRSSSGSSLRGRAASEEALLDRDTELKLIDGRLERAVEGAGGVLAIEGPAGIGKTSLLEQARRRGRAAGVLVLAARGGELECELAFGVVRQLLERHVASLARVEQARVLSGAAELACPPLGLAEPRTRLDRGAALHGLYWLLANLADEQPVLVLVDDIQWCDPESLEWLVYVTRRIDETKALVCVALRTAEESQPTSAPPGYAQLAGGPLARTLRPGALSSDAVASLLAQTLGRADPALATTCTRLTGGNPFALNALLAVLADHRGRAPQLDAASLERMGGGALAGSVLGRIQALGEDATVLAVAACVIGAGALLHDASVLAQLPCSRGQAAADVLREAGILRPSPELEFDHPLTRAAVYESISVSRRAALHKRAARLLADRAADDEAVATQLLVAEPAGDAWVVEVLLSVARKAGAAGAPRGASRYLERALREPPASADMAGLLHELGMAEAASGQAQASARLRRALELAASPQQQTAVALDLALLLSHSNQPRLGVELLSEAVEGLSSDAADGELVLAAESVLCGIALLDLDTRAWASERLARLPVVGGASAGERALLATRCIESVMRGRSAEETVAQGRAALGDGQLLADVSADAQVLYLAINGLVLSDNLSTALEALDAAVADARRRGSVAGFTLATCWRANALLKSGAVAEAEADARASIEAANQAGLGMLAHFALAFLLDALLELDRAEEAEAELLSAGLTGELASLHHYTTLLDSRGRVRLALGRVEDALTDFLECGRRQLAWGYPNPAPLAWRSNAARAYIRAGATEQARALAREELELAREYGAARPTSHALRGCASVCDASERVGLLREAELLTRESEARLEHAHALVELGAELRRRNSRGEARSTLREGLVAAERCGALALAATARVELGAAGARTRVAGPSGADSLTASQRRVAEMAARGLSNPEIAQALFVTRATVESHLHAAYRKLGIASRTDLADALSKVQ